MDYKEQLLSVYPNCKANVGHSRVTIVEIYDTVRNDAELKRRTEAYRQAMEAKEAGKVLKTMKAENFPMFVPAVLCKGGRNKESIESWTCFCQADFDNIDPELLDEARRRIRELKFVVMYHVSMGGRGLHVYYVFQIPNCGMNEKVYEQAFRQGNELIANAIPADYDTAVESPTHGSSLCHDPEAWLNTDLEPLKVDMSCDVKKRRKGSSIVNSEAVTQDKWPARWTAERVFSMAQGMVDRSSRGEFAQGNRNNYLVALACLLSDYGMNEETAAQLMVTEYSGQYGEEPIPSLVRGCYKTVAAMHGKKALPDSQRGGDRSKDVKMELSADFIRRQCLRFDVISRKIVKLDGTELTDRDINSMLLACNVEMGQNISLQVFRAALMSDCVPEFNPLTEYLKGPANSRPKEVNDGESIIDKVADMVHVTYSPLVNISDTSQTSQTSQTPQTSQPPQTPQTPQTSQTPQTTPHPTQSPSSLWHTCFRKWFVSMVAS
ncbi:MAG: BT4734/BF3469 family protein, partial [Prevotella sp.]